MEKNIHEDEISLKELIQALLGNWKIIAIITAAALAIGALWAWVIKNDVYESKIEGIVNVSETVETRYGAYPFSTKNKNDYLSVIQSERVLSKTIGDLQLETTSRSLSDNLEIETGEESSRFTFTVKGGDPSKTKKLLDTLSSNYMNELEISQQEKAATYFINRYGMELHRLDEEEVRLKSTKVNDELILSTLEPTITLKKLVASDPVLAAKILEEEGRTIEDLTDDMMLEEVINPNYSNLQTEIISIDKQLNSLDISRDRYEGYLSELEEERDRIIRYRQNPDVNLLEGRLAGLMDSQITIYPGATLPTQPVAPNRMMIMAIAGVLGLMLGAFAAFFREYWKNS